MEVVNNKRKFRFEIALPDGEYATLEYRWLRGSMVLMHTVVPKSQQGKGIGSFLIKYVLDHVRSHHLKMIPYCPFVLKYLESHPEDRDLIDPQHKM